MPPLEMLPRGETLVLQNTEGSAKVAGWFNPWVAGGGGRGTGLQQLALDTLWYFDPLAGEVGTRFNALAAGPPEYNPAFTEMTVRLRDDIAWSDGSPFSAADVVYTVELQIANAGMALSGAFNASVAEVIAPDPRTVRFNLRAPNPKFHELFTAGRDAAWIIPKHILEKQETPLEYDYNPPVGLGPYVLHSFDPHGAWYVWERRADWQRTAMAALGEPLPRFVVYRDSGDTALARAEMAADRLDLLYEPGSEAAPADSPSAANVAHAIMALLVAAREPALTRVVYSAQPAEAPRVQPLPSQRYWTAWPDAENAFLRPDTSGPTTRYLVTALRPVSPELPAPR